MKIPSSHFVHTSFILLLFSSTFSLAATNSSDQTDPQSFLQCLTQNNSQNSTSFSKLIYTPNDPSYTQVLRASINNLRFASPSTPKPRIIVTPNDPSQIQTVIFCSKKNGMQIRIRGGGHDFEGLSYVANVPFVLLDMINLKSINVDVKSATAWVEAGATLGELYYGISQKSRTLGFPGGLWSTVGVTGYLSGGGYGMLRRKYGLGADNVIDVRFIDANGKILNRKSMGEDLFWAVRGGGGSSFGVILSWNIKLVPVPDTVTVFRVNRTLEQNVTDIFYRFQSVAPKFPTNLDIRCYISSIVSPSSTRQDNRTISIVFESLYLGKIEALLPIMQQSFPELRLTREDCSEVSWIQSGVFLSNFSLNSPPNILLDKNALPRFSFKGTSDFVQQPISKQGLNGIWDLLFQGPPVAATLQITPWGGRMYEISESATPFPHRRGNLYMVNMGITLEANETQRVEWIRNLYKYMTPYVSKLPRVAYVNYNDLDFGVNSEDTTSYAEANRWARRYFKNNFDRLVRVKAAVDPDNFFRHEQSIPVLA